MSPDPIRVGVVGASPHRGWALSAHLPALAVLPDLAEATELADLANAAGVVHAVGLQGVHSPDARFVGELLAEGRVGQLRSVSVTAASGLGGARIPLERVWAADPAAGVTALSIIGGHVLATLATVAGEPVSELSAVAAALDPEPTVIETGERISSGAPGQIAVAGQLAGGAVLSVALQGGAPASAPGFSLSIAGTDGVLTVTPQAPGGALHISGWRIRLASGSDAPVELTVPERLRAAPPNVPAGPPANVAALYREIAAATTEGRAAEPSFDTAVGYHRLLDAITAAAGGGTRQTVCAGARAR